MIEHVLVHELAHVLNNEIGHGDAFQRIMHQLTDCTQHAPCEHIVPYQYKTAASSDENPADRIPVNRVLLNKHIDGLAYECW